MKLPSDLLAQGWCQGSRRWPNDDGTIDYCHVGAYLEAFSEDDRNLPLYRRKLSDVIFERYGSSDIVVVNDRIYPSGPKGQRFAVADAQEAERRAGLRSD